jgi:hypothetical protein
VEPTSPSLPQVEEIKPEGFSPLFWKVQKIYTAQFREWFTITAPTSVLAAVVVHLGDQGIRSMFRSGSHFYELYNFKTISEAALLRFSSYFFAWFLGCFALAAIATAVNRLDGEDENAPPRGSHARAREHLWAIIQTAIATFFAFLVGMAIMQFAILTLAKIVGYNRFVFYMYPISLAGAVLVAGIVSRLGMAIPLVVRGDSGAFAALNESLRVGERHKGLLFLLVTQSLVGSYVGWYAAHYLLLLVPLSIKILEWYGWAVLIVFALASAAVQPPIFVGFSLLAEESLRPKVDTEQLESNLGG